MWHIRNKRLPYLAAVSTDILPFHPLLYMANPQPMQMRENNTNNYLPNAKHELNAV
jgi:hypothetical protein